MFVCSVNEGSVAAKAGLKYGDQLLEVRLSMFNCVCIIYWCHWTKLPFYDQNLYQLKSEKKNQANIDKRTVLVKGTAR